MESTDTTEQKKNYEDTWEDIGYHRITGGFYYFIIYAIIAFGYVLILPLIIPYSEAYGMYLAVHSIFASVFTFADFGLASALSRFIAEYRVKNPIRTQQYIRFFIWFQGFTGLLQTTVVSIIGLYGLKGTYLGYLPWIFVAHSIIQFPGWLGVFSEALKGFHQFDKIAIIGLLNMIVFQNLTLFAGAQLGVYFGQQNPAIGPVMGSAIGITIGMYVDDFTSMVIAGWMFSKVAEPLGFRIRDVFIWDVPKDVIIESLKFGLGVMLFVVSYESIGSILILIYAAKLPNYAMIIGMIAIIGNVVSLPEYINSLHYGNHRPSISEAYFNGKKNYAEYIMSNGFRTTGQFSAFITALVVVLGPAVVKALFAEYWDFFNQIFVVYLLYKLYFQHSHFMNEVLIGTGNHKFNILITIVENVVKLVVSLIMLAVNPGLGVWILIYASIICTLVKQGIGWVFINKRIISLHFNPWQMWIAPAISGFIYYFIIRLLFLSLSSLSQSSTYQIVLLGILVIFGIYILPGPFYFLPLGFLGGYDENTLRDFEKAAKLAGLSKIIVNPWVKGASFGAKHSKLHNRFPMFYTNVAEEIRELMILKQTTDYKLQDEGDNPFN